MCKQKNVGLLLVTGRKMQVNEQKNRFQDDNHCEKKKVGNPDLGQAPIQTRQGMSEIFSSSQNPLIRTEVGGKTRTLNENAAWQLW